MTRLANADLMAVLDATREVQAHTDLATLPQLLISVQSRLVPCDISTYNEIDTSNGQMQVVHDYKGDDAEQMFPRYVAHAHEHPIQPGRPEGAGGRALKVTDFVSQRRFERLAIYNEFYRHFGIRFNLAVDFLPPGPRRAVVALQRIHRDFSERDRQVLSLMSPHFAQALENAQAFETARGKLSGMTHSLTAHDQGVICVDPNGRIAWMTVRCDDWLRGYFGSGKCEAGRIPDNLKHWLAHSLKQGTEENALANRRQPLVVEGPGSRLTVRLSEEKSGQVLLLLSEQVDRRAVYVEGFGLSEREQEVVRWIAQGKTNPEIARILDISPRTVHKHVEHFLEKMAVENRAGIMLQVMDP